MQHNSPDPGKPAVSARGRRLSRRDLINQADGLYDCLTRACQPGAGEAVAVQVRDPFYLLLSLVALYRHGVRCIPIDPDLAAEALAAVLDDSRPAGLITDQPDRLPPLRGLRVLHPAAGDARTGPARGDTPAAPGNTLLFYHRAGEALIPQPVSAAVLAEAFAALDDALLPGEAEVFLVLDGLPYRQKAIDLLWAYSRGVHLLLGEPGQDEALDRFVPTPEAFALDFGLFFFGSYDASRHAADPYGPLTELVKYADANGFGAVWTPERHFNAFGGLFPNPGVLSAALAVLTSQIQIRSGSIVSPLHNTIRIAEDWALVDNLSKGRAALSFASGWQCDDFAFCPDRYASRYEVMLEQIATVKRLWRGEKVRVTNGLGKETEVAIFPRPVQEELPVWVTAAGKTETFEDAGRIGAHVLTHLLWQDSGELIHKIAAYRKARADNGFDPRAGKVAVMVHTYLGSDYQAVKALVKEPLKQYISSSVTLIEAMAKSNAGTGQKPDVVGRYGTVVETIPEQYREELLEIAFNRFFEAAGLLGTVESCHAMLRKLKTYDVDEVACLVDFGLDHAQVAEGLRHLDQLRRHYDGRQNQRYPVALTHCTAAMLRALEADPASQAFLNALRRMAVTVEDAAEPLPAALVETGTLSRIKFDGGPGPLHYLVQLLEPEQAPGAADDTGFNAVISREF